MTLIVLIASGCAVVAAGIVVVIVIVLKKRKKASVSFEILDDDMTGFDFMQEIDDEEDFETNDVFGDEAL